MALSLSLLIAARPALTARDWSALAPRSDTDTVSALMSSNPRGGTANPIVAAIASWIIPGAGYWLIGQRARALAVGITVIVLFVLGLLIGGIRVLEVPG